MAIFYVLKAFVRTLLLFVAGVPIAVAQIRCKGGFFVENGRCVPCPPGFFGSQRRCSPCPAGTFNPVSGAITRIVCRRCPENTFSLEGSGTCKPCPSGLASTPGSSVCLACGPGTSFSPLQDGGRRNRNMCKPCPRGSFSNGTANLNCDACPEGLGAPRMSTSGDMCDLCPPGRFGRRRQGCIECPSGTFKAGRLGRCRPCPSGTMSPPGATSCTPCPKGARPSRFGTRCFNCPPGKTTAAEGGRFCRAEGEPCPRNSFDDFAGNCQLCSGGSFFNASARTCQECPQGSVSRGRLETKCQVCPPGARPDIRLDTCICDDGMVFTREGACEKCPPGSFSRSDSRVVDSGNVLVLCIKCPPGTFQDEEGASECKPCPLDSISREEGASKCDRCPPRLVPSVGTRIFKRQNNIVCVMPTTGCPPGFRRNPRPVGTIRFDTPLFGCDRIPCLSDTAPEEIGKTCAPCEPGTSPNLRGTRCSRCARDEFSSGLNCQKCPEGLIRDPIDGSKCSCKRFAFGIQDGVCSRCRRGTVSSNLSETCRVCPPGTESLGATECSSCRRGSIAPRAGSGRCTKCPEGTFSSPVPRGTRCVRF